ncbi:MAG: 5-formyltetrahydrofolate cyclo-ligase [Clostridia bacterium]|nr:5-formyltetrahydrofolate cyclo-ligase [Clostridia bacterium]
MPVNEIKAEKTELRAAALKQRRALGSEAKNNCDVEIQSRVLTHRSYIYAETIFTYVAAENEVETRGIIHAAWAAGKNIAVPKCIDNTNEMQFYIIKSMSDLKPGVFGIMEPDPEKCRPEMNYSRGLCIVPGLTFDMEGYRIGYGKGYYDRFLKKFNGTAMGLCYSSGIRMRLPRSEYDIPVNIIVSERFTRDADISKS